MTKIVADFYDSIKDEFKCSEVVKRFYNNSPKIGLFFNMEKEIDIYKVETDKINDYYKQNT